MVPCDLVHLTGDLHAIRMGDSKLTGHRQMEKAWSMITFGP